MLQGPRRRKVCVAVNGARFGNCMLEQAVHIALRPDIDELHIVAVADDSFEPDSEASTVGLKA